MQDLNKRLLNLEEEFLKVWGRLDIDVKLKQVAELEREVAEPEIWKDVKLATEKNQELARLGDEVQPWQLLKTQIADLKELIALSDEGLKEEIDGQLTAMESQLTELKKALRFNGEY